MKIIVNGINYEFDKKITLEELIDFLNINSKVVASAVNMEVIKIENRASYILEDGDRVELLNFVGGG